MEDLDGVRLEFEQKRRLQIRKIIVLLLVGALVFLGSKVIGMFLSEFVFFRFQADFISEIISLSGAIVLLIAAGMIMNIYLRYGPSYLKAPKDFLEDIKNLDSNFAYDIRKKIENLEEELLVKNKDHENVHISKEEKAGLFETIKLEFLKVVPEELIETLRKDISETVSIENQNKIRDHYNKIIGRLTGQVEQLTRRGNLNLVFGILATLTGFIIFWYLIPGAKIEYKEPAEIAGQFIPRFSLVILIEVFAYFFLGLYRSSLSEIKYFQNELTNIESKLLALEFSALTKNEEALKESLTSLATTERNFTLKKGETTVGLEHEKIIEKSNESLLNKLESAYSLAKKN